MTIQFFFENKIYSISIKYVYNHIFFIIKAADPYVLLSKNILLQSQDTQFYQEDQLSSIMEEEPRQQGTEDTGRKPYERRTRQQKQKLEEYDY